MVRLGLIHPSFYCNDSFSNDFFHMKPAKSLMLKLVIPYDIIKIQTVAMDSASSEIILFSSVWLHIRNLKDWEYCLKFYD